MKLNRLGAGTILKAVAYIVLTLSNVPYPHAQTPEGVNKQKQNATLNVTGTVIDDATGKPLGGIRISLPGVSAAITEDNGSFTLKVPSYKVTIEVAGEGFQSRQVALKGRSNIKVQLLDESIETVYDVVNTPQGSQTRVGLTSATANYSAQGAWANAMEIPDAQLQGQMAGLNAVRRSGTPGVGANLWLRGFTSLYATNKPLLIIDNMIFDYNDYGESIIANNYTNPLALIDMKDIDNITVLKDASSIYGTKGANGALIITTARARQQATKIDFAAYTGINLAPEGLPVMQAGDYRTYLSELLQSRGLQSADVTALPFMNDAVKNAGYYATHNNTNWQRMVMGNTFNQNYYLKVTGGDNIATYALSMGFLQNKGVIANTDLTRYNTRFNAQLNFSQRFTGSANLFFTYNEQNLKDQGIANGTNPLFTALIKAPFLTNREVNDEGAISPNLADADMLGVSNPSAIIENMQAYNKYYRFFGSFGFKYDISKSLSASTMVGITFDKVRENIFVPRKGISDDSTNNAFIESRLGTQVKRLYTLYNDTRLTWQKKQALHSFTANAGMRYQNNQAEQDLALGFNSATDELVSVQNGLNALRLVGGGIGNWLWMNFYANADYQFRNKLFLSVATAVDGSSRFGVMARQGLKLAGRPFAVMPSVAAAWLVSSEDFMANSGITLLKVRASLSQTGNDDIGNYSSRQTYRSQNWLGMQGLVRSGIANPALQWEVVTRSNAGVDIGFWNDRVQLSLDAWQNKTTNMLTYEQLPTATGFEQILTNGGAMRTRGIDASLQLRAANQKELKWDISLNASNYHNEVTALPGNNSFITNFAGASFITQVGQPANQFYGLTTNGVFTTDAEAAAANLFRKMADGSLRPFKGGDMRFNDLNGDGLIDDNDRRVIGNPNPKWFGGIGNRLVWRRFTLDALVTFSAGNDAYNYVRNRLESVSGVENQLLSANNRWRGNGHVTNMPKATWADPMGNASFSDRWIEDASYLRLRTLSIAYQVPMRRQGFIKDMNVYATGNNLLTFTKYLGYDPEFSARASVFAMGVDTGLDPIFRSIMLGVKLGL